MLGKNKVSWVNLIFVEILFLNLLFNPSIAIAANTPVDIQATSGVELNVKDRTGGSSFGDIITTLQDIQETVRGYVFQASPQNDQFTTNAQALNFALSGLSAELIGNQQQDLSQVVFGDKMNDPYRRIIDDHLNLYCASQALSSIEAKQLSFCEANAVVDYKQNADLNVGTFLSNSNLATDEQKTAAKVAIKNILFPFPDQTVQDALQVSTDEGSGKVRVTSAREAREKLARAYARAANLSPAILGLNAMMSNRMPKTADPEVGEGTGAAGLSVMDFLESEATRRFSVDETTQKNAWLDGLNQASGESVLREIAILFAFQNYLLLEQYKQTERLVAIQAASLSSLSNLNQIAQKSSDSMGNMGR